MRGCITTYKEYTGLSILTPSSIYKEQMGSFRSYVEAKKYTVGLTFAVLRLWIYRELNLYMSESVDQIIKSVNVREGIRVALSQRL